jgi:hypothetical protein
MRLENEQERLFEDPLPFRKNPKTDGPIAGEFHKNNSKLRAGLAKDSSSYGTPVTSPCCPKTLQHWQQSPLLGGQKMPQEDAAGLPGVGVQCRAYVLVHQRHDLSGRAAEELAQEDGNLQ